MSDAFQAIRGMNDVLPTESVYWQLLESICREVVAQYGYQEVRFPLLEQTNLFKRSIGDATDIVEKEMYTFLDRNGDSISLRPEGTAGCVRAGIEHGLLYNQLQRFWYMGPMFRHERPQKGRLRQFHQLGVEAFGFTDPVIDAELIVLSKRILDRLELSNIMTLELNTLGTSLERKAYQEKLVQYFQSNESKLDDDSKRRLHTNPMRILDSKNEAMQSVIKNAPVLSDYLSNESKQYFDDLCALLKAEDIAYHVNSCLVRGLDYYCHTVFEWTTTKLGAQGAVCGGGRYDGLVAQLGGKPTSAAGFGMGLERIILLLQEKASHVFASHIYVVSDIAARTRALQLCELLRDDFPSMHIEMDATFAKFGAQLKRADKSGAKYAIIIGENELRDNQITLKNLRSQEQQVVSPEKLISILNSER